MLTVLLFSIDFGKVLEARFWCFLIGIIQSKHSCSINDNN